MTTNRHPFALFASLPLLVLVWWVVLIVGDF